MPFSLASALIPVSHTASKSCPGTLAWQQGGPLHPLDQSSTVPDPGHRPVLQTAFSVTAQKK